MREIVTLRRLFLQGVSIDLLCKPCSSYDQNVRVFVCPSHADIV